MEHQTDFYDSVRDLSGLSVKHSRLVHVSTGGSERECYAPLAPVLHRVQSVTGVAALFVAEFLADAPVIRRKSDVLGGAAYPHEAEYGAAILKQIEARPLGDYVAVPVVAEDGTDFGTVVCCKSAAQSTSPAGDLLAVARSTARILALCLTRSLAVSPQEAVCLP